MVTKLLNLLGIKKKPEPVILECKDSKAEVIAAIVCAARDKGVDPALLLSMAQVESSMNPNAKATTSSAIGLFQFIDSTWTNLVKAYGKKNGVCSDVDMRTDPHSASVMMCELINENRRYLEGKGIKDITKTDLYIAHFLGPRKAMQFIAQQRTNGSILGVAMFPTEAKSNPGVFFYKNNVPKCVGEIYKSFTEKLKDHGL